MHKELMKDTRGSTSASGEYRTIQNFIGPTKQLKDASYVPHEPQLMSEYMANLERYINGHPYLVDTEDKLHPLIKVAIIHAQLVYSSFFRWKWSFRQNSNCTIFVTIKPN